MKTLQSNFTTPEQSKRLLKLGVPADSADCYIYTYDGVKISEIGILRKLNFTERKEKHGIQERLVPCWSAGRLIEIYSKCNTISSSYYTVVIGEDSGGMVEQLIIDFETLCKHKKFDFSKLEK